MIKTAQGTKPEITLPSPNNQTLMQLINGYWVSQMIHVAAKLGIADLVSSGPKTAAELAKATGMDAAALYRVLRALASTGIFAEDDRGRFQLTPLAEPLRSDAPDSVRDWAIYICEAPAWRAWEQLGYSVETGKTAFPHVWGMNNWEYRAQNPEANEFFNKAMTSASSGRIGPVLDAYDFSGLNTIVDVGGGHGTFIATILKYYPGLHGVLFDLPHVAAGAAAVLKEYAVADRCKIVSGSFLEAVPDGGDAYLLSKVLHDWNDEKAVAILKVCRQSMKAGSKLLVVEAVIPPGNGAHPGKLNDINMLISNTGGRERTEAEFRGLLETAGFGLTRIIPTVGEVSVVEGAKS